jgi:hypothetical protein
VWAACLRFLFLSRILQRYSPSSVKSTFLVMAFHLDAKQPRFYEFKVVGNKPGNNKNYNSWVVIEQQQDLMKYHN